jgi:hypothetical protein
MAKDQQQTPRKGRWRQRFSRLGLGLVACAGAVVGAEIFLRALVPVELMFETWFTPGIQQYDERYNVVYAPGWSGLMRHADKLQRGVPLELGEDAFRLPVTAGEAAFADKPLVRVVLLGGRSAIMSYGLPDEETVAAAVARHLSERLEAPVEVRATEWAGDNLHRNWNLFRERLGDRYTFDAAVICHVNPSLGSYRNPAKWDVVEGWGDESTFFGFLPGIVVWPNETIAAAGPAAYQSYLGYGLLRLAGQARFLWARTFEGAETAHERALRVQSEPPEAVARDAYIGFLGHLQEWFEARETRVLFHFIPRRYFAMDLHDPYTAALPDDFAWVDLHRRLFAETENPDNFLANHHYAQPMAEAIGALLAEELADQLQSKGQPEGGR